MTFCLCSKVSVSSAVLYVGGRPVAQTEYVRVDVVVLHAAGATQDAHRRRAAAGQNYYSIIIITLLP